MTTIASALADSRAVAHAYADVLDYPHASPVAAARACADVAAAESTDAAELLQAFVALVESVSLGELQEAYTRTFDLDMMSRTEPTCYPYVGHYLFDESHKRSALILGLRERFREAGFVDDSDLPDHLVVLLRFLAQCDDEEQAGELVDEAILPALTRMDALTAAATAEGPTPVRDAYLGVLRALTLSLAAGRPALTIDPITAELEREWARNRDSLGIDRDSHRH